VAGNFKTIKHTAVGYCNMHTSNQMTKKELFNELTYIQVD